jgi:hypothetical protein
VLGRGRVRRVGLVSAVVAVLLSAGSVALAAPPPSAPLVAGTPCTATARACADLVGLRAWLFEDGRILRGPVPISIGDELDPTPPGRYQVEWKAKDWVSREYGSPMPYSVFFAPGGIAFHEGSLRTNSAGCIRLVRDDAAAFFEYLQVGDEVQVHSDPTPVG